MHQCFKNQLGNQSGKGVKLLDHWLNFITKSEWLDLYEYIVLYWIRLNKISQPLKKYQKQIDTYKISKSI